MVDLKKLTCDPLPPPSRASPFSKRSTGAVFLDLRSPWYVEVAALPTAIDCARPSRPPPLGDSSTISPTHKPPLLLLTWATRHPSGVQAMAKSSKMLNFINYRMRVTIQDRCC